MWLSALVKLHFSTDLIKRYQKTLKTLSFYIRLGLPHNVFKVCKFYTLFWREMIMWLTRKETGVLTFETSSCVGETSRRSGGKRFGEEEEEEKETGRDHFVTSHMCLFRRGCGWFMVCLDEVEELKQEGGETIWVKKIRWQHRSLVWLWLSDDTLQKTQTKRWKTQCGFISWYFCLNYGAQKQVWISKHLNSKSSCLF